MSTAQCPACLTAFRVSDEQLAIRGGRVRCGHCYRPFNALEHLLPEEKETGAPPPPPPLPGHEALEFEVPERFGPPRGDVAPAEPPLSFDSFPSPPDDDAARSEEPTEALEARDEAEVETGLRWRPASVADGASLRNPFATAAPKRRDEDAWVEPSLDDEPDLPPPAVASVAALSASLEAPDDIEQWRTSAYDPNPAPQPYRWLWALGTGVLLGTLIAQASFIYREPITREWPQLRPVYLEICTLLGCEVALPRVIGGFNVATTRLEAVKEAERHYVLQAEIVNLAGHPQQLPYLELSLRDKDDQPIARRAFGPGEWMPADRDPAHGVDAGERLNVSLPFSIPENAVPAGFRVNLFYP
jgi:predicted Zn finger-like uncharacterized protein